MPADLSLVLTYGAIFLLNAFFHSSRVGLTPISRFFRMDAGGIVTVSPCMLGAAWLIGHCGLHVLKWGYTVNPFDMVRVYDVISV